ncbi:Zn-dependent hydrolase [Candidatus Saccharibacteria bacterium]|nr:Zn-dependent hydrolase [Candidatus Saccharibacteria bacterium]NCU40369.1 Zn-dependent hydrolase [Candidatus Saccharibacteria bacterium]
MDFEYKGGNCITVTMKDTVLVFDGNLSTIGLKDVKINGEDLVEIVTQEDFVIGGSDHIVISTPGEYEVKNISIKGISAKRLIDFDGQERSTIYRIRVGDISLAVIGHIATPLSDDQFEAIGVVDILVVPVGGGGYTLDSHQAVEIVNKVDPKVVIPTHYADKDLNYEVPQEKLDGFIKELSAPQHETMAKWKIKNGNIPQTRTLIEINRTA